MDDVNYGSRGEREVNHLKRWFACQHLVSRTQKRKVWRSPHFKHTCDKRKHKNTDGNHR